MNERQLKYFLEVYSKKSITMAAKELFITPQGLSKTINSLEKELQVQLFEHHQNKIVPTANAAKLAIHAKNILEEYSVISSKLFTEKNAVKPVRIYCSYDVPQLIPASFFKDFNEKYPEIRINIKEYPDDYIIKEIEKNKAELAIIPGPFHPNKISFSHIWSEPFCLVVPIDHPFAKRESVKFSELSGESIVIKDINSHTSLNQLYTFNTHLSRPNVILETSDIHLIHQMAIDGAAIGISLDYLASKIKSDKIKVIPFEEDWLVKKLYLVHNNQNVLSSECQLFYEALVDFFANKE